jgi:hypothetical protein
MHLPVSSAGPGQARGAAERHAGRDGRLPGAKDSCRHETRARGRQLAHDCRLPSLGSRGASGDRARSREAGPWPTPRRESFVSTRNSGLREVARQRAAAVGALRRRQQAHRTYLSSPAALATLRRLLPATEDPPPGRAQPLCRAGAERPPRQRARRAGTAGTCQPHRRFFRVSGGREGGRSGACRAERRIEPGRVAATRPCSGNAIGRAIVRLDARAWRPTMTAEVLADGRVGPIDLGTPDAGSARFGVQRALLDRKEGGLPGCFSRSCCPWT